MAKMPYFGHELTDAIVYFTYEPLTTIPPKDVGCAPYYQFKNPSRLCIKCNITGEFPLPMAFRNIDNYTASVTFALPPTGMDDEIINKYLIKSFRLPTGYHLGQLNKYTFSNTESNSAVYILSQFITTNINPWPKSVVFLIDLGFDMIVR